MARGRLRRWTVLAIRRLGWSRNPMCRASDRVEGLLIAVTLMAALLAIPVAIGMGRGAYDDGAARSAAQQEAGHWGTAKLLESAPGSVDPGQDAPNPVTTYARARWQGPNGSWSEGDVPVRAGTDAGSTVRVWVDAAGQVTKPPLTPSQLSDKGVATAITALMGLELGIVVCSLLARWSLDRRRLAAWGQEWERVAPRWSRKYH
ncbi:hypothetical protein SAMN05421678_109173 [Actinopolymorpha cephalotaxi]|uniref:Uncharacterized protein n=2 Tax=Actinopolymorpha cephalotaxi TaxID=504797 RepID=A0A1I2VJ29_9ACTN|nr:hypothetical protein [Actinopolymorpha cephalotaxi]SFG88439.1 hypothetical protein SAMN05421678_109173 [Actinopolymorpha cephalotaxi]